MLNIAPQSHPPFEGYREDNRLVIRRPLRKAISSLPALSSFELLSLKTPIFEGRRGKKVRVMKRWARTMSHIGYMGARVELYRMEKKAI